MNDSSVYLFSLCLFVCFVFVLIYVTSSIALQFFVVRSGTLAFLAFIVISRRQDPSLCNYLFYFFSKLVKLKG